MKIEPLRKIFDKLGIDVNFFDLDISLPLAYQAKFDMKGIRFYDQLTYLLVKETRPGTLESFIQQAEFIGEKSGLDYILTFTTITNEDKRLLLKARIPFADSKGNLFLPELGLVLAKQKEVIFKEKFKPSEQLIFSYIIGFAKEKLDLTEIQNVTGISVPTIYRSLRKFVSQNWLGSEYGEYYLKKSKREIYEEGEAFLFDPIKQKIYIEEQDLDKLWIENRKQYGYAGHFALSKISMLDETKKAVAMSSKDFNQVMKRVTMDYYEKPIPGLIELQLWYYTPIIVDNMIDPFSLYVSLKDDEDPRVALEVSELLQLQLGDSV